MPLPSCQFTVRALQDIDYHNPRHPLNSELSDFFQPAHITRYALRANSVVFGMTIKFQRKTY